MVQSNPRTQNVISVRPVTPSWMPMELPHRPRYLWLLVALYKQSRYSYTAESDQNIATYIYIHTHTSKQFDNTEVFESWVCEWNLANPLRQERHEPLAIGGKSAGAQPPIQLWSAEDWEMIQSKFVEECFILRSPNQEFIVEVESTSIWWTPRTPWKKSRSMPL